MQVISTIPPYAPYIGAVIGRSNISGARLNTMMPIRESVGEMLTRVNNLCAGKDFWLDLKCRQLRTTYGHFFKAPDEAPKAYQLNGVTYVLDPSSPKAHGELVTPPWAEIGLSHPIKLDMSKGPIKLYMQDGYDSAMIAEVAADGKSLIMLNGPKRVVGGGESINILDPSLEILGNLTENDINYINIAKDLGIHTYMLSYVEQDSDITDVLDLDSEAKIVAKIESIKGLQWVASGYAKFKDKVRLMAARGDLYVEVGVNRPDRILRALRLIIRTDPTAIVASRILTSLREKSRPICPDITDIDSMLSMGYRHFMVGDDICFDEDALMLGLDMLAAIGEGYYADH
jgi:pyruvate kinase